MPIVKEDNMDKLLPIAIPTFNRAEKLSRLLKNIETEVTDLGSNDGIQVLISDNASTDNTKEIVELFSAQKFPVIYFRQNENIGFDRNVKFLYEQATTKYVWFMADDDLPLKGAIAKVVKTLEIYNPDVLLFSFIQPPGSTVRQFDYPEAVRLVSDPISAIEHTLRYTKVSIFVIRKVEFNDFQWRVLDENLGYHWYYLSLAFSVLEASPNLQLAIISEPLATCDKDYFVIAYIPDAFLHMEKIVAHPFVFKHSPELFNFYKDKGYCTAIEFAFAAKCGSLSPEYPEEYDKFIKELECRISTLFRRPRSLIQFMALKLRIARLWPRIRPVVRWIKPLSVSRNSREAVGK